MRTQHKILHYLLLISLFVISLSAQTVFDNNRANVWVINGEKSQSFNVENWSTSALIQGSSAIISTELGANIALKGVNGQMVIVNNVVGSTPLLTQDMPVLSLIGLNPPTNSELDVDQPSVSISPSGGTFEETVEVTFTLVAPSSDKEYSFVYKVNDENEVEKLLVSKQGQNTYTMHLAKHGEYSIRYGIKGGSPLQTVLFTLTDENSKKDSDNDGIPDTVEVALGMDPLSNEIPDSDNDGWNDFDEFLRGTDMYAVDSTPIDSDKDGWSDWDEDIRGTDKFNTQVCIDKPTVNSLYGVEYKVNGEAYLGYDATSTKIPVLKRMSLVSVKSENLYDSSILMNLPEVDVEDLNTTLCHISKVDLNASLSDGNITEMRIPADLSIIARAQALDEDINNTYVVKSWIKATPAVKLQEYLASTEFDALSQEEYTAEDFRKSYTIYLSQHLVVDKNTNIHQKSSFEVAMTEMAFKTREVVIEERIVEKVPSRDLPITDPVLYAVVEPTNGTAEEIVEENEDVTVEPVKTLLLGNPEWDLSSTTYINVLHALSEENRTTDDLYTDVLDFAYNIAGITDDMLSTPLAELFAMESNILTEQRFVLIAPQEGSDELYLMSLLTILSLDTIKENTSLFDKVSDSDSDGLTNTEEVTPVYYTHPLDNDSDDDGIEDNEDSCPLDETNQCINDEVSYKDIDKDGVIDAIDNCPFDANPSQKESPFEGIGYVCAKKGIVIVHPRTNISLFKGERYTFEAKVTLPDAGSKSNKWFLNNETVDTDTLSYEHVFDLTGTFKVCTVVEGESKDTMPCITVTVLERDISTELTVYPGNVIESDEGVRNLLVEVVLNKPVLAEVKYTYVTQNGTATDGSDYHKISGELLFLTGEIRKYLRIPIVGDLLYESDETFNLAIGDSYIRTITILNDDEEIVVPQPDPVLHVEALETVDTNNDGIYEVMEGDVNKIVTFLFALSKPAEKEGTTLHYTTNVLELKTIVDPDVIVYPEYHSMIKNVEGDLTFGLGEQFKEVNVTIIGDRVNESDKTFTLRLTDAVNITLHDLPRHTFIANPEQKDEILMIVDNDPLPKVSFETSSYTTTEGESVDVRLMLSSKSYQTVEVNLSIGIESTATEMDDYNLSTKHVVIKASNPNKGTTNKSTTVTFNTFLDADPEELEYVILDMSSTTHAVMSRDLNTTTVNITEETLPESVVDLNVFMDVDDGINGAEPWMSDGSVNGTYIVKNIAIDGNSSSPENFTKSGEYVYFITRDEEYRPVLYRSTGNWDDTIPLYTFESEGGFVGLSHFTDVKGVLYFIVQEGEYDASFVGLWKADPNSASKVEYITTIKDGGGYDDSQIEMTLVGDILYFPTTAPGSTLGTELYKFDTLNSEFSLVKDIVEGEGSSSPSHLKHIDNMLYFFTNWGQELWKSDGTLAGTVQVLDPITLEERSLVEVLSLNGMLYFSTSSAEFFSYNEVSSTLTKMASYQSSGIHSMLKMGDALYYLVVPYTGSIDRTLVKVVNGDTENVASFSDQPYVLKAVGDMIYLRSNYNLKSYDGTQVTLLKTWESGTGMKWVEDSVNDYLFFTIDYYNAHPHYDALWRTDGTVEETIELPTAQLY